MKIIIKLIKTFLLALFIIYIFNIMAVGLNIYVPVTPLTLLVVGFLKIPGLILIILFIVFIF